MNITRLFDFLYYQAENYPIDNSLVTKKNGEWVKTSTSEYIFQANQISRGLLKLGIQPGDKIAIATSVNRTEWNIMDIGIQQIGAVSVPVYPTISEEDYKYIFNNSKVKLCFVSDKDLYAKMESAKPEIPSLVGIYTFDDVSGAPNWKEVLDMGEDDATQHEVEDLKKGVNPEDLVTIIYTSGTTGKPKGVMLTHENIVSNVLASKARVPELGVNPKALSFLPICHVFERMLIYLYHYGSIAIYYAESMETIGDNLKEIKPEVMTVVPRLVEKVYAKIYDKGASAGGIKTKLFMWAMSLTKDYVPYKKNAIRMAYQICHCKCHCI